MARTISQQPRHTRSALGALRRAVGQRISLPDLAEDVLTSILNISSEGVIVTDSRRRILVFSKGAEAIFGYSFQEVAGRSIEILLPADRRQAHREHVARFAHGSATTRRMQSGNAIVGRTQNGDLVDLEVGLSKLVTPNGVIFTAIVRDTSERREAEASIAHALANANAASEAKSSFLASMSHEIRTPLNGVLGMAQAMSYDELTPIQRGRLDVIRQSGESLLAILNDILDLSKIEAGKLNLEIVEFDLRDLVRGAYAAFTALANAKGLSFSLDVAGAEGIYRGDPTRLRQIIYNLISNALKFTESGEVRVTARRDGERLRIAVSDTGIGIPASKAGTLFDQFTQADSSTTRRFGGTGLGLAICRQLVKLMQGEINLQSTLGEGSVFTVSLPLERLSGPVVAAAPGYGSLGEVVAAPAVRTEARVLAAEDNVVNQLVLKTLLHQIGIDPVIVETGRQAVEAWEASEFDLVLMDVRMPDIDGVTATAMIRERESAAGRPRTPIWALTANAMSQHQEQYRNAGMDGLIAKPIEIEALFSAIASAIPGAF